jgi:hypothetical protein
MSRRQRLGLAVLLAFAVVSAGARAALSWGDWRTGDEGTRLLRAYDTERYEAVRAALPPGGEVGYVEDEPGGEGDDVERHFLTQYALAPAVVVEGPEAPLVLVNGRPEREPDAARSGGWRLLVDAGNGVRLYRREGR